MFRYCMDCVSPGCCLAEDTLSQHDIFFLLGTELWHWKARSSTYMFMALDERGEANSKSQAATNQSSQWVTSRAQCSWQTWQTLLSMLLSIPKTFRITFRPRYITFASFPIHLPFCHSLHAVAFGGRGHCPGFRSVCWSSAQTQEPSCSLGHG